MRMISKGFFYCIIFLSMLKITYSQELICDDFKQGSFFLISDEYPELFHKIYRTENSQIEINQDGEEYHYWINWLDECTYVLRLKLDRKLNKKIDSLDLYIEENGGVLVEFMEIKENCIISKASIRNIDDEVSNSIICLSR